MEDDIIHLDNKTYSKNRDLFTSTDHELFQEVDKHSITDKKILDHGCGSGKYAIYVKEKGAREIIGIDNDPFVIHTAINNTKKDTRRTISFLLMNAEKLPTKWSNSFDMVISNFVLHHFTELHQPLKEIHRVMKYKI